MDRMTEQAVELYEPDKTVSAGWYQRLCLLNKESLEDLAATFRRLMRGKRVTAIDNRGNRIVPEKVVSYLSKQANIKKSEILDFLCFMLADIRNFLYYINSLSEQERKVWEAALSQYYLSSDDIFQITGERWAPDYSESYFYYGGKQRGVSDKLVWFSTAQGRAIGSKEKRRLWDKELFFSLDSRLYAALLPVFFPEACSLEKHYREELPAESSWHTFSGEPDILVVLSVLNRLYDAKQLAFSNNKFTQSVLRKLSQLLSVNEFFPDAVVKELALFRCSLLANLYALGRQLLVSVKRPEEQLKNIFLNALHYPTMLLPVMLPHLSGLRKNGLLDSYGTQVALSLWNLMGCLPQHQWIAVEGIHFRLLQTDPRYMPLFSSSIFDKMEVFNSKLNHGVYLNNLYREVSLPFINGLLYAMAAFGFIEVAYTDVATDDVSYTSSLAYIRLTSLGAFVWGQVQTYIPSVVSQEQGPLFELDEQHLIVRSLVTPNPYQPLLAEMSIPLSGNRYRVTPEAFLAKCRKHKDVEDRIALFKQYICPEASAGWEEFFKQMLQHSQAIKKAVGKEYVIYRISPDDKDLQRIVSIDPFIRQYSLRAEDYLWLVEAQMLDAVKKRLKEYGYLFS